MLKRVSVTGTQDGEPVYHEYAYVDFRPYVAPPSAFEVCKHLTLSHPLVYQPASCQ